MEARAQIQRLGRYELLTTLGRGGMAELWLARLNGLGGFTKLVAIKRILPHLSDDPTFVELFLREGRVAARLSHPNVCSVFELGEAEGQLFLAMEYLEGVSWEQMLTALPRGDVARARIAAGVLGQACDGLHYAHESIGLVHRDVSPQNLFVTVDGVCKILDFGVAKVSSEGAQTHTGMLKGKLPYMSPEQLEGVPVDARADVFAAGIVLWEALTASRLFVRDTDYLIFKAVMELPIPAVSSLVPLYGRAIDDVVARALERDPARRYPTIAAFADELRDATRKLGGAATATEIAAFVRSTFAVELEERDRLAEEATGRRGEPALAATKVDLADTLLRPESIAVTRRRSRRWSVALAIGGLGAAGVVVWAMRGGEPAASARAASEPVVTPVAAAPPDASVADEPIEIDPDPHSPASPPRAVRHAAPRRAAEDNGFYSVDSEPYATIYVDGKRQDQTPLFRVPLAAGQHRVLAVLADGRKRAFTIAVKPGGEATSGTLRW